MQPSPAGPASTSKTLRRSSSADNLLPDPPNSPSASRVRNWHRHTAFISDLLSHRRHSGNIPTLRDVGTDGYDAEFARDFAGPLGHGVKRFIPGFRGWAINFWDRSQGWIIVTITGFLVACIAAVIVILEMWLFDIRHGVCATDWKMSKRRCCPADAAAARHQSGFIASWLAYRTSGDSCPEWRTWSETLSINQAPKIFNAFILITVSLVFAGMASSITIYLSSSESVYSTKDETAPAPARSAAPLHFASTPRKNHSTYSSYGTMNDDPPQKRRKVMYFAAGSGIPEIKTILSGFVIRGYLGIWTLITKSIGLFLSVASGLSLGKEGPFVHIGSCIGNIISRFFSKFDTNEAKRREILSAACAAGVAVAFGAPIGGVLFSLEEVSYFFPPKVMWRSFFCAMIAAATLKAIDPFNKGKIVLFEVSYDRETKFVELFGFVILGLFGGIYGAYFSKANIWWSRNIRNKTFIKNWPVLEVLLVTALTVFASLFNRLLKSAGTELVYEMFAECRKNENGLGLCIRSPDEALPLIGTIAAALIAKGLLTVITFGIKVPAGIFIPTLAVGACFGRIAALFIELTYSKHSSAGIFEGCRHGVGFGQACVLPGIWAMVGAASTLAGVTRTTVSLAVIMFELTGTLTYVVPVMLSVLVAKTTADAIEKRGIYDLVIDLQELPFLDTKREYILCASPKDVSDREVPVIVLQEYNTIGSMKEKVRILETESYAHGFPILTRGEGGLRLHAYITARDLSGRLAELDEPDTTKVFFTQSEEEAMGDMAPPSPVQSTYSEYSPVHLDYLIDNAPVTVNVCSPMELLHEMFVKLGVRYLVVVDENGIYCGVIEKNRWLGYLEWSQEKAKEGMQQQQSSRNGYDPLPDDA